MVRRSQLSATLSDSELSDLYSAIASHVDTSFPKKILRGEITKIVEEVLKHLEYADYLPGKKSRERAHKLSSTQLEALVDEVVRRRVKHLEKSIEREKHRRKKVELRRKKQAKEYIEEKKVRNMWGGFGRQYNYGWGGWPWMYPVPVECGRPMWWYYAPYGYQGWERLKPQYVWGIPKSLDEKRDKKKGHWRRKMEVENLHIHV